MLARAPLVSGGPFALDWEVFLCANDRPLHKAQSRTPRAIVLYPRLYYAAELGLNGNNRGTTIRSRED
jgi:hypothetical protein